MIIRNWIIPLFFLVFSYLNSQTNPGEELIRKKISEYFGFSRESIFLHLNKSKYILGEEIWFKGYVFNRQKQEPLTETSNLYVGIYNSKGKKIKKWLYQCKEGFTEGNITLDSTFTAGVYYIKASTQWMRNFREDDAYVEKIKIYDSNYTPEIPIEKKDIDVQFLPEGGNLINDAPSVVGVKAIDYNGLGVKIKKGIVLDQRDTVVAEFNTSKLGFGKFEFTPNINYTYRAHVTFDDDQKKSFSLPKISKEGISIIVKETNEERVHLILLTNSATLPKLVDKPYTLFIHRDGVSKKLDVNFTSERPFVSFVVEKKSLLEGINILTLIDNLGKPILERLIFNFRKIDNTKINAVIGDVEEDSLDVSLKVVSKIETGQKNLSISVLPSNTKSYGKIDNILSTFLLKPYLKGFIENPSYYFTDFDLKKERELNLLLLTQGWSRYDWKNILKNPPIQKFDFEEGILVTGNIKSELKPEDKLLVYTSENPTPKVLSLSFDKKFGFFDYLKKNGKLFFSIIDKRGELRRPELSVQITNNNFSDKIVNPEFYPENFNKNAPSINGKSLILPENGIALNEVTVEGSRIQKKDSIPTLWNPGKITRVTKELSRSYPSFVELIRTEGYKVRVINYGAIEGNRVQISTQRPISFPGGPQPSPLLYINDVREANFDILATLRTEQIKGFFIDRFGNVEGGDGAGGGIIRIYMKESTNYNFPNSEKIKKSIVEVSIKNGFENSKEFYVPRYTSFSDLAYQNFGVIHWIPQLKVDENGMASFKILNTDQKEIALFIEGMGIDGALLSESIHLTLKDGP